MHSDRQGLQQRALSIGQPFRQAVNPLLIGDEVRGQASLSLAILEADISAEMVFPSLAEKAPTADDHRFNCDAITWLEPGNLRPNPSHLPGDFVPHGDRQIHGGMFTFENV
jgi:hypothetical protein